MADARKMRVGILGAANIAKKNARAIRKSESCVVVAVASRDPAKAAAWIKEWAPTGVRACTYDELLADAEVDCVYVPLPTTKHVEWVARCAQAGKHVLLEKPIAPDLAGCLAIARACRDAKRVLMDGTMFMHHERTAALRRLLDPADAPNFFGHVTRVTSAFSFRGDAAFFNNDIRCTPDGDPLGCLGDLGWYCIRLGLIAYNWTMPILARGRATRNGSGIPIDASAELVFPPFLPGGAERVLSFHCSFSHTFRQVRRVRKRPRLRSHARTHYVMPA